ncbi:uncharacterized protein LOC141904822 [Tubulanus polymorphus]|uniref:uncharacterized protein LOC141904822 n=1 Tax=Tubulanus polymorphus TaxID=672921 RepID=UPI003DA54762
MASDGDKVDLVHAEVPPAWTQPPPSYPVPPMTVYTAGYQPPVLSAQTRSPAVNSGLHGCGAVQIAIGVISLFIGILEISMSMINYYFYNFWCPLWFILAGAFAVAAAKRKVQGKGFIVTSMVFSIISSISSFVSLLIAASFAVSIGTFHDVLCKKFSEMEDIDVNGEIEKSTATIINSVVENMRYITCDRHQLITVLLVIDTLLFLTEFITSIVQSAFCCKATCCARRSNRAF